MDFCVCWNASVWDAYFGLGVRRDQRGRWLVSGGDRLKMKKNEGEEGEEEKKGFCV
jgi:hypothetical protein